MASREIKFRALFSGMDGEKEWKYIGANERFDQAGWSQETPWLQYTGLKDKNGREMYEGDLIREVYEASGTMPCATFASPVIFEDASFCLDDHTPLHELIDMKDHDWCVIGNIHENPELIPA